MNGMLPAVRVVGKEEGRTLGTIDLLMVETTPVVFKDRLYRFEYVRDNYHANETGASYFRFIDVSSGNATPAFAKGFHLGCAFADLGFCRKDLAQPKPGRLV